jgi:hypothetical protein
MLAGAVDYDKRALTYDRRFEDQGSSGIRSALLNLCEQINPI